MPLLALLITLTLTSSPGQGRAPLTRPARPACESGDPCCPPALGEFCRVGCPPPVPTPIFRPAPDVATLEKPQPTGVVLLEIAINESGRAISACVVRSLRPDADKAAQRAALRSTWTRKLLDGRPVGVFMTVSYEFPPPAGWTEPVITPRSALPLTKGPVVFVDPAATITRLLVSRITARSTTSRPSHARVQGEEKRVQLRERLDHHIRGPGAGRVERPSGLLARTDEWR